MATTKQVKHIPNPSGKGGFGERPEDRNDGRWNKEDSISYQYNKLMRMSVDEFNKFVPKTIAQDIAIARIRAARDARLGLNDAKEITDRTEGKAPQAIDVTSGGEKINVALVEFVDSGNNQDSDKDS